MKVAIGVDRGRLRLRWQYKSRTKSMALGLDDSLCHRAIAAKIAEKIQIDIELGHYDESLKSYRPKPFGQKKRDLTFDELIARYMRTKNLEPATEKRYRTVLTHLNNFFANDSVYSIGERDAYKFKTYLLSQASNSTVKSYLIILRAAWKWASDKYEIQEGVWTIDDIKAERIRKRRPFTQVEIAKILEEIRKTEPHYYPFVAMLFTSAARPGEVANLTWQDVSPDCDQIDIWASKTRTERTVHLPKSMQSILQSMKREGDSERVFKSKRGKKIYTDAFGCRVWKPLLKNLNITYRSIYVCRHSAISMALANGVPLINVAAQSGHGIDVMAKYYASSLYNKPVFAEIPVNNFDDSRPEICH